MINVRKGKNKSHKEKRKSTKGSKRLAVIPYSEGLSEMTKRTFCKYEISTAMKPYRTFNTAAGPPVRPMHSRPNRRVFVHDSMLQL